MSLHRKEIFVYLLIMFAVNSIFSYGFAVVLVIAFTCIYNIHTYIILYIYKHL